MTVIGLTGSLATGKSTVARMFARFGARVIDSDKIARRLLRPGAACFAPVVKAFGEDILKAGKIDRRKLAQIVFADQRRRRQLERIIHPFVRKVITAELKRTKKRKRNAVVVIEVPLLFEVKFDAMADHTIAVKAGRAQQIARATKFMGLTKAEAKRRIQAQMPLRQKIRLADIIIDNSQSIKQTQKQVKRIWERL